MESNGFSSGAGEMSGWGEGGYSGFSGEGYGGNGGNGAPSAPSAPSQPGKTFATIGTIAGALFFGGPGVAAGNWLGSQVDKAAATGLTSISRAPAFSDYGGNGVPIVKASIMPVSSTSLSSASVEATTAEERMFDKELAFREKELAAIKQASTMQSGAGVVSAPATKPTSEVAKKADIMPLVLGLGVGYFVLKKKRGK